jgi:hypothetical protein
MRSHAKAVNDFKEKRMPPARPCHTIRYSFLLAVPLLVVMLFGQAGAADDPYRGTSLELARQLVLSFPPAEGYVISVQGTEVYLDLAEDNLMRSGMELLIFREGAEIIHPVSQDVLGRYEDKLGYVTLTEVQEKYSVGTIVEGAAELKGGDRVRISARPLRALLLFLSESPALDAGRLARELTEAAEQSKRFRLRDEPEWLPRLKEVNITIDDLLADPALLRRLGEQAKADLLLVVDPAGEGEEAISLEVRSLWTGRTLAEFRQSWSYVPAAAGAGTGPSSSSPFAFASDDAGVAREYVSKELSSSALSMLAGDLRGEGTLDFLITDGSGLSLYTWEAGGLIWKGEDEGRKGRHVLALEAGDLDGDGTTEVLVTAVRNGRLKTEVVSWGGGEWHVLGGSDGLYVRVFEVPGGETILLGQRSGVNTVFAGAVRAYSWDGGTFRPAEGLTLPAGVDIFGLTLADVDGDGTAEILSLNEEGNVRTYTLEGKRLHRTSGRYGGYPERIKSQDLFGVQAMEGGVTQGFFTEGGSVESSKDADRDIFSAFQGRLMAVRESVDGPVGIAVPRNFSGPGTVLPNLRQFDKGRVSLLQWEDGRLAEVLQSRRQEGYVSDVAVADSDGDGRPEIFMAVNRPTGALLRKKGTLVVWRYHLQGSGGGEE